MSNWKMSGAVFGLLAIAILTLTACPPYPPRCPAGYTGKDCDRELRGAMLGDFLATDYKDSDSSVFRNYTAKLSRADSTVTEVTILNFGGILPNKKVTLSLYAESDGGDNIGFLIPLQQPAGSSYFIKGNGWYYRKNRTIILYYSLVGSTDTLYFKGIWYQQ